MLENDGIWNSVLKQNPSHDGLYYTYIFNKLENCNEVVRATFENSKWIDLSDELKILAWKEIRKKMLSEVEKDNWIKEHEEIICTTFLIDSLSNYFIEIIGTFLECVCDHDWFLINGYIKYIDEFYVLVFC